MTQVNDTIYYILVGYEREAYNANLRGDKATVETCVKVISRIKEKYNLKDGSVQ